MRKSCLECLLKHIADAWVLAGEIENGHVDHEHVYLLIGNLSQAESHGVNSWKNVAETIRKYRRAFSEALSNPVTEHVMEAASKIDFIDIANTISTTVYPPIAAYGDGTTGKKGISGV